VARQLQSLSFVMKVRKLANGSRSGWVALTGLVSTMGLAAPAWASTTVLDEVVARSSAEGLRIELRADGPLAADAVSVKADDGVVYFVVRGVRVHADRRSWNTDLGLVKAHRHRNEVELVVPTGGIACASQASFDVSQTGLVASLTCSPGAGSGEGRHAARAARREAAKALDAEPAREPAPRPVLHARDEDTSRSKATPPATEPEELAQVAALVALPAEPGSERPQTVAPTPQGASASPVAKTLPAPPVVNALPAPSAPAKTLPAPSAPGAKALPAASAPVANAWPAPTAPSAKPVAQAPSLAAASAPETTSSSASVAGAPEHQSPTPWPAFLIVGATLAGVGIWWKKRQGTGLPRRIQIRETASLGPKRSLVVAEIDGERVILAASEAGITLLQAPVAAEVPSPLAALAFSPAPAVAPASPAPLPVAPTVAQAAPQAASDPTILAAATALFSSPAKAPVARDVVTVAPLPEPELEGAATGLARLRALAGGLAAKPVDRTPAPKAAKQTLSDDLDDDWFDEVLDESVEDQELRAKLAAGAGSWAK